MHAIPPITITADDGQYTAHYTTDDGRKFAWLIITPDGRHIVGRAIHPGPLSAQRWAVGLIHARNIPT